ncbi:spore cortex biosynthesis protein YabQ [Desulfallas sp. Bu1-1]|uniref:spore cortex biosynthesis protein YabQ n=1 Tax=Desulfallas sp. Bu1-1 TaxID=2787620 RepID=UPI00189EBDBB|nr:spore cortex biosynthesis protein YabQ [Desulfallas sp. Bu1-1]MBF7082696.1 spore cortex biosynthesis protein YabQ [Desulfallas sp. Bu1-1]
MTDPVTSQFMVFLYTILTGALAGLVYDIYAGFGYVFRLRKAGILVGDLIFWLVMTPLVYALLLHYNQGEVRFFVLLGLGGGAALYFYLFRDRVRVLVIRIIQLVIRFLRFIARVIIWLAAAVVFPFRLVYTIVSFPFRLTGQVLGKTGPWLAALIKRLVPAPVKRFYRRLVDRWIKIISKLGRGK